MFIRTTRSVGRWLTCLAAITAVMLATTGPAGAADRFWNAPVTTHYDLNAAWTGGVRPAIDGSDAIRFNVAGTYGVLFDAGTDSVYGGSPRVGSASATSGDVSFVTSSGAIRRSLFVDGPGGSHFATINGGTLNLGNSGASSQAFELVAGSSIRVTSGALNVWNGSRAAANTLHVGNLLTGQTAALLVSGSGATAAATATSGWGVGGNTANVTFENNATGSFAALNLANSNTAGTTANVLVQSGAELSVGNLVLATEGGTTSAATLDITGTGSAVTQTGDSTLTLGHATSGTATIDVLNGGVLNTGTGTTTVNATGSINIGAGGSGTFNANGNVNVNAGSITRTSGSFNLAAGRTLTASNNAQINLGGSTSLSGGTTWNVESGADLFSSGVMNLGTSGGTTAVTIDGAGSSLNTGSSSTSTWGFNGHTAEITVRNGASANLGHIELAASSSAGTSGTIAVESGGTVTMGVLVMALPGGPTTTATVTVTGSGSSISQTGVLGVGTTGGPPLAAQVNVFDNGTFNTSTILTSVFESGHINIDGGTFNANSDVNISGGSITRTSGSFNLASGRTLTATGGAQINLGDNTTLSGGTTWSITNGAELFSSGTMSIGVSGGVTDVTIDGAGSSLTTGSSTSFWGLNGSTAQITVRNGATANVGGVSLAADLGFLPGATGTITVTGTGSTLTQTGSSLLTLGHASSGTATLNVLDGGTFTAGAGGTVLQATGVINITGGNADLKSVADNGGTINFNSGSLSLADLHLGPDGPLSGAASSLSLSSSFSGKRLAVSNNLVAPPGFSLAISGSSLSGGTLHLLSAATLTGIGGTSTADIAVTGSTSSTINVASSHMTLGKSTALNGFYTNGTVNVGANALTILDANDAVFDSGALLSVGSGSTPGTVNAANGLTLNFGGNITGHGTINTPDNPAKPFINNGNLTGDSLADPLTLVGYVKGVGSFDNVEFTGTFSPGFSPAKVNLGSAVYDGTLHIEIGGLAPGSGHDQLNHILGDGIAHLGGTLDVSLLGGFMPAAGDVFEIITAASISGTFANTGLPALAGDLFWSVNYGANSVTLAVAAPGLPGDFNQDGAVNAADYVFWRKNNLPTTDYDAWRANFGAVAGGGSGTSASGTLAAVPEPASLALLLPLFAAAIAGRFRRQRR